MNRDKHKFQLNQLNTNLSTACIKNSFYNKFKNDLYNLPSIILSIQQEVCTNYCSTYCYYGQYDKHQ